MTESIIFANNTGVVKKVNWIIFRFRPGLVLSKVCFIAIYHHYRF